MKRSRHTPEQVIRKLREAEVMLGEGKTIAEAAKELGVSRKFSVVRRRIPRVCAGFDVFGLVCFWLLGELDVEQL